MYCWRQDNRWNSSFFWFGLSTKNMFNLHNQRSRPKDLYSNIVYSHFVTFYRSICFYLITRWMYCIGLKSVSDPKSLGLVLVLVLDSPVLATTLLDIDWTHSGNVMQNRNTVSVQWVEKGLSHSPGGVTLPDAPPHLWSCCRFIIRPPYCEDAGSLQYQQLPVCHSAIVPAYLDTFKHCFIRALRIPQNNVGMSSGRKVVFSTSQQFKETWFSSPGPREETGSEKVKIETAFPSIHCVHQRTMLKPIMSERPMLCLWCHNFGYFYCNKASRVITC